VTIFYTAPTLVRSLMRDGTEVWVVVHYVLLLPAHDLFS
jgi:acyl-coenzyme A synthetase/AMP-(fatty) acid ligase